MGRASLIRDGSRTTNRLNAQTLQAAYQNGLLSDAKSVVVSNALDSTNQPHIVDSTSINKPTTLSWGIREVFFTAIGTALLSITGSDTSGNPAIWMATATTESNVTTIGDWVQVGQYGTFGGTNGSTAGSTGLVPAPTVNDKDKFLMGSGSWKLPWNLSPVVSIVNGTETATIYEAVDSPTGNPSALGYYVLSGGTYTETTDTSVVSGTTYYEETTVTRKTVTTTHQDGTTELLVILSATSYRVTVKDSSNNIIIVYRTVVDSETDNVTVTISNA